jgi:hypothetical protein
MIFAFQPSPTGTPMEQKAWFYIERPDLKQNEIGNSGSFCPDCIFGLYAGISYFTPQTDATIPYHLWYKCGIYECWELKELKLNNLVMPGYIFGLQLVTKEKDSRLRLDTGFFKKETNTPQIPEIKYWELGFSYDYFFNLGKGTKGGLGFGLKQGKFNAKTYSFQEYLTLQDSYSIGEDYAFLIQTEWLITISNRASIELQLRDTLTGNSKGIFMRCLINFDFGNAGSSSGLKRSAKVEYQPTSVTSTPVMKEETNLTSADNVNTEVVSDTVTVGYEDYIKKADEYLSLDDLDNAFN